MKKLVIAVAVSVVLTGVYFWLQQDSVDVVSIGNDPRSDSDRGHVALSNATDPAEPTSVPVQPSYVLVPPFLGYRDSVHPNLPHLVYEANIDRAMNGDPRSMYWVSKSFRNCGGVLKDDDQHAAYMSRYPGLQEVEEEIDNARSICRPMFIRFPDSDFLALARGWLARADEAGDDLARIEILLSGNPSSEGFSAVEDKIAPLLLRSVQKDGYPAYYLAQWFLRRQKETVALVDTWHYLACSAHPACSQSNLLELYSHQYIPREFDGIKELSKRIAELIESKSLVRLDGLLQWEADSRA